MRNLFFLLALACGLPACTTTYYIVRHAERQDNSADTPLSAAGFARADILRDTLLGKGIDLIYASTFQRTQQTAQPLATALQLPLGIYRPDTTAGFIAALKQIRGKQVLVVGHSNTIPQVVEDLSGHIVAIPENDFDNLFVVRIRRAWGSIERTLEQLTYGAPSP